MPNYSTYVFLNIFYVSFLFYIFCFLFYAFCILYCFCIVLCTVSPFALSCSYFCTSLPNTATEWKPSYKKYQYQYIVSYHTQNAVSEVHFATRSPPTNFETPDNFYDRQQWARETHNCCTTKFSIWTVVLTLHPHTMMLFMSTFSCYKRSKLGEGESNLFIAQLEFQSSLCH